MGSGKPRGMFMVQPLGVLLPFNVVCRLYVVTIVLTLSICVVLIEEAKDVNRAFASSSDKATPGEAEAP